MKVPDVAVVHPPQEELAAFAHGRLGGQAWARVAAHLDLCPACCDRAGSVPDDDLLQGLRPTPRPEQECQDATPGPSDPTSPRTAHGDPALPSLPGFQVMEELGRGGVGVVYRVIERKLNRPAALKVLATGAFAGPEELSRFFQEAHTLARVQHPNIVSIHHFEEGAGAPYFVMEYVSGGSLAQKWQAKPQSPSVAARLVAVVARAVHHAHQEGVVHRDLKPANVLLTEEGTPKISDFGLARRLEVEVGPTCTGAVLGTPSYMAPEQAAGKRGTVGPKADVYALGALLYEGLTGRPPFLGETHLDTLAQVRGHDPVPPRKLQPQAPRDLETIALKCLEKEPTRRYGTAEELAKDLERWLAGEPVQARRIGRADRLWRWCRRNPAFASLIAAATVFLSVVVGGTVVSNVLIRREQEQTKAAYRAEAEQRGKAQVNSQKARKAVDDMYTEVAEKWLPHEPRMEPVRRAFLLKALQFYQELAQEEEKDPTVRRETARLWGRVGNIERILGEHGKAEKAYRQAITHLEALAADFPNDPIYRADLAGSYFNLGTLANTGRLPEAETVYSQAITRWQKLADESPSEPKYQDELAGTIFSLAQLRHNNGRLPEAEHDFGRALSLQEELVAKHSKNVDYKQALAKTRINLGLLLAATGRRDKAKKSYEEALSQLEKMPKDYPVEPAYRHSLAMGLHNLGVLLAERGSFQEAEEAYRRAIGLGQKLASDFPAIPQYRQTLAKHFTSLGNLLADTDRQIPALDFHRQAIDLQENLVTIFPKVPEYRQELSISLSNAATVLVATKQREEAEDCLRRAVRHGEKLAVEFPEVPQFQDEFGTALSNWSRLLQDLGKPKEARPLFDKAIDHRKAALKLNPRNPAYRQRLANQYRLLGEVLVQLGEHSGVAKAVAELPLSVPEDWHAYYFASALLSRCVPLAERDLTLQEKERAALAQSYGKGAMQLLEEAVKKGYKDAGNLKQSPEFEALRNRDDFNRLVKRLESKAQ
jgi:tetratricopeptide (TPR) repeat protein